MRAPDIRQRPPLGAWVAIGTLALAVRFFYLWEIHDAPGFTRLVGDGVVYDDWARALAAGDWLGQGIFYQAPLYPYFLGVLYAVFGHDLLAVRIVQCILGALACALLRICAVAYSLSRRSRMARSGSGAIAISCFQTAMASSS